jgi:hypothetical protein
VTDCDNPAILTCPMVWAVILRNVTLGIDRITRAVIRACAIFLSVPRFILSGWQRLPYGRPCCQCNSAARWTEKELATVSHRWRFAEAIFIQRSRTAPRTLKIFSKMQAINTRAKFPSELRSFCRKHNLSHRNLLSVNPKTEKSEEETRILHFAPSVISGHNVCPGAGNCAKVCLHFAGIPYLMGGKRTARIRRTLAYFDCPQTFLELTATAILYNRSILTPNESLAIRLNGTSDIKWETIEFTVSPELSMFWRIKFGVYMVPTTYRSIIHMFAHYPELLIKFYDYTKVKHDWAECKSIGYHLTFSYDGADNKANLKLACVAISNGINVAAAFNIKKGGKLPPTAYIANRSFRVVDGDKSDFRPSDPNGYVIVGLRFKLPHGVKYTQAEKRAFCLA